MIRLAISGKKTGPDAIDWGDLAALPGTIEDVSTEAPDAVGAAAPLAPLIDIAGPEPDVRYCTVISADGAYRASIPLGDLRSGGWLAYRDGDHPLPTDKGGPLRLTVAVGRTLCWNVKDVGELRFTSEAEPDNVPARPTH